MGIVSTLYSCLYHVTQECWNENKASGVTPIWIGPGAASMGYHGTVTPLALAYAMVGRSQNGECELIRSATVGQKRYGTEILLCAPPGFSALLATTPEEQWHRIFAVHESARRKVLKDWLTQDFVARTGAGGAERTPGQLAAATMTHLWSRRGTPIVHEHTVVLNQGFCPADGKTRSVEKDPLFQNARQMRADYQLHLSNEAVQKLGVSVERVGNTFTVVGMKPEFLKELTPAKSEIAAMLLAKGVADTPAARAIAAKLTRPEKTIFEKVERAAAWHEVAHRHEVTVSIQPRQNEAQRGPITRDLQAYKQVSDSADRVANRRTWIDMDMLRLEATRSAFGSGLTPQDIAKATERWANHSAAFGFQLERGEDLKAVFIRRSVESSSRPLEKEPANTPSAQQRHSVRPPSQPVPKRVEKPEMKAEELRSPRREPERPEPESHRKSLGERLLGTKKVDHTQCPRTTILVRADRPRTNPQSLERLLVDLKKTPLWKCHAKVFEAVWGKWFANLNQKLSYAEAVFRLERQPKIRLTPRTTIVVANAKLATPQQRERLNKVASRTGASVRWVDPSATVVNTTQRPATDRQPVQRQAKTPPPPTLSR